MHCPDGRRKARQNVQRYGPQGTFWKENKDADPNSAIRYWEIWNEPNIEFLTPPDDPNGMLRTEFYAMFGIGPYTVANYKVVWKRMASDLVAAVASQAKTPYGFKTIIPTDTTSLIATEDEKEIVAPIVADRRNLRDRYAL